MKTIDRYLFGALAMRAGATLLVIFLIMSLENVSRLTNDLQHTDAPAQLLGWLTLYLLPEHLAIAVPIAIYLATALTVRALALNGEWPVLAGAGMPPWRILAMPMAIAAIGAAVMLVDRLEARPAGERALDALYAEIASGLHGAPLPVETVVALEDGTVFYARRRPGRVPTALADLFVIRDGDIFAAPTGDLVTALDGRLVLRLADGSLVHTTRAGGLEGARFRQARLETVPPRLGKVFGSLRHRLDRFSAAQLVATIHHDGDRRTRDAARAALAARIDAIAFCLLLPVLGLAFGMPPRRGQGGAALLLGIFLIVLHLQWAVFVEDHLASAAYPATMLGFGGWAAIVVAIHRWTRAQEAGAWDRFLIACASWLRVPSLRR